MVGQEKNSKSVAPKHTQRIPEESLLYGRLLPLAMIVLALLMVAIVVFAAGILIGIIPFK